MDRAEFENHRLGCGARSGGACSCDLRHRETAIVRDAHLHAAAEAYVEARKREGIEQPTWSVVWAAFIAGASRGL